MEIDIVIDRLTDCLIRREDGARVETTFQIRKTAISKAAAEKLRKEGWQFDWSMPQADGYQVYELFCKGKRRVEGRIALKHYPKDLFTHIELVESAPFNIGRNGEFEGVGGNLFAIACKLSFEAGFDGYVQLVAKTQLIEHYRNTLGASLISSNNMIIGTSAAKVLVDRYFLKGGN